MVALPTGDRAIAAFRPWLKRFGKRLAHYMPGGLYARSLIIVVAPMVLLQAIVVLIFMERHWDAVTRQLSAAVTRDIALLVRLYETYEAEDNYERLIDMARDQLEMSMSVQPGETLPTDQLKPFFSLLDKTLSAELSSRIGKPYWIDTLGRSRFVEIRIKAKDAVIRVIARRSRTYASNTHIFVLWMVGSSLVLLAVAISLLRNQIRPIQRLAEAAEAFGMGRDVGEFRPRGAREVKQAAQAFLKMRQRIERQIEQRTTMLAGVSHDLRTLLTRFKLQLAFLGESAEIDALEADVNEMQHMLEDYLAFARGDGGEIPSDTSLADFFAEVEKDTIARGETVRFNLPGPGRVKLKPNAFKRCVLNLVHNACRFADDVQVTVRIRDSRLYLTVDDNGPGIPAKVREEVFRPFYRLDDARNQDTGGTGLGLAIARDIVIGHGGDITLSDSELGGLKVAVRIPI
ncbi:Osmolarity sensor protein EnvZ [hydrothermal vent metagenome]|uniref:histidine kinase n=1 Tax=hydrothermal vent metagenome TaxID=652676 RepID=A0A3B0TMV2_9ZZZZ